MTSLEKLKRAQVAIAGMGGAGGAHADALAREGIGRFKIADFDTFETANFNRQAGAFVSTIGRPKVDVMEKRIKSINPSAQVQIYPKGLNEENLDSFLEGIDVVVDALDFFCIDIRRRLFSRAYEKGIPVVTAAPLGFGAAVQVVMPGGMTQDDFYGFKNDMSFNEKMIRFAIGISPKGYHLSYLDKSYVSLQNKRGPSSMVGVNLSAFLAGQQILRILTGAGPVWALPYYSHYDLFKNKWFNGKLTGGHRHPLQKLKLWIARRQFKSLLNQENPVRIEQVGEPLAPSVTGTRESLSAKAMKEIRGYMKPDPIGFLKTMAITWLSIGAAVILATKFNNLALTILAIFFIGTRQNVLGLLSHEQVHRCGFKSRWGDFLTNFFCSYPIVITVEGYRNIHLAHHKYFFTEKDPDYRRKQGKSWTFPQRVRYFTKTMLIELFGLNIINAIRSKRMSPDEKVLVKEAAMARWIRLGYYAGLAAALTSTGTWRPFLIYWVFPLVTVLQAYIRWAAIVEHKYNLVNASIVDATPIVQLRWWEKLLFPNINFSLHVYHHYWSSIPFTRLPRLHEIFREEGLLQEENVFHGYWSYLKFLFQTKESSPRRSEKEPLKEGGKN